MWSLKSLFNKPGYISHRDQHLITATEAHPHHHPQATKELRRTNASRGFKIHPVDGGGGQTKTPLLTLGVNANKGSELGVRLGHAHASQLLLPANRFREFEFPDGGAMLHSQPAPAENQKRTGR